MKKPLLSVIVPVYNVAPYIDKCISSILSQTYANLEIIIVDDGSTDDSGYLCDKWGAADDRVRVIHTANRGVSHARNIGLNMIRGEYVGFVDADDWLDFDMYEQLMNSMIGDDADIVGGGYVYESSTGERKALREEKNSVYNRDEIIKEIFSPNKPKLLCWEISDKLFRREVISNIRMDEDIAIGEDMLFFWQIMKNVRRFSYVPLFKYHYRMRQGSAVHSGISAKTISGGEAVKRIWEMCMDESQTIRQLIFMNYAASLITVTRAMLLVDATRYEADIRSNQKIIRKHIVQFMKFEFFSIRMKMGTMFLCFPYFFCRLLSILL